MILFFVTLSITACAGSFFLGVWAEKRDQRIERELEDAEKAKTALVGRAPIDGHELPPPDVAWRIEVRHFKDNSNPASARLTYACIVFGPVAVTETNLVFVGGGCALKPTQAIVAYSVEAWKAYRNQVVRAALEGKT